MRDGNRFEARVHSTQSARSPTMLGNGGGERDENHRGDCRQRRYRPQRGGEVLVRETFDAETENPAEMQRAGWQAILDNFGQYVECKP